PDNFYHSSADVAERTDPTEMKRIGFVGAASFYYLAIAEADEAMDLAWEASANGEKWMAEVTRQSVRLMNAGADEIHDRYKAAHNKVYGAFQRGRGSVASVTELSSASPVTGLVGALSGNLEVIRDAQWEKLQGIYGARCQELGVRPQPLEETEEERRYDRMVPRKLHNYFTEEYQAASGRLGQFFRAGNRMPRLATSEIQGFVDGERSITEIWRLVRAEYGNVTTSNHEWKYAYVVTPETVDVRLADVAAYVEAMEQAGMVEITPQ
ncbi:MAG: hypothetical protein KAJ42_13610, partial [Gemmatimonadetes bacterium]|nr:hypothetical protein [Gemmatimonadota bacterium]